MTRAISCIQAMPAIRPWLQRSTWRSSEFGFPPRNAQARGPRTRRTKTRCPLRRNRRKLDDLQPVPSEHVHRLDESREGDGLVDKGVHAELVASNDVFVQTGRR